MPTKRDTYKTNAGAVVLDVSVGDAGTGVSTVSLLDPVAHATTPIPWVHPPDNPKALVVGAGATLASKILLVTTTVTPFPAATWTSCGVVLAGGVSEQHWSLSEAAQPAVGGAPTPSAYTFVFDLT
jgi:hypothetical protein